MTPHVISATVDNIVMVIATPITITLLASEEPKLRRWSGITGMFGQIFWVTSNCTWDRWGMCLVSSYMAAIYARSFATHWVLPIWPHLKAAWYQHTYLHIPVHVSIHFRHGRH